MIKQKDIKILFLFLIFSNVLFSEWDKTTIAPVSSASRFNIGIGRNDGVNRIYYSLYEYTYSAGSWIKTSTITSNTTLSGIGIGKGRNDATNRIFLDPVVKLTEFSWNGTSFTVTSTIDDTETSYFWDIVISTGRSDNINRVYVINNSNNIYEYTFSGSSWTRNIISQIETFLYIGAVAVGCGRNDSVIRVYAGGKNKVYEFTYSGGWYNTSIVSNRNTIYGISISSGRNDGVNRIYVACSEGLYEYTYQSGNWQEVKLDDTDMFYDVEIGRGMNDSVNRVYGSCRNGDIYQYTYSGGVWYRGSLYLGNLDTFRNDVKIAIGRNDGVMRVYSRDNSNLCEFSWTGVDSSPTVSITYPNNNSTVCDLVNVTTDVSDDLGIQRVEFYVDNQIQFTDYVWTYSWQWDTSLFSNSMHNLKVIAYDTNNSSATHNISVTITRRPIVSITSPVSGATVSGVVAVNVSATDDSSVNRVEFYINNSLQNIDYTVPYSWNLDTTKYADGDYSISVVAYDDAGFSSMTQITVKIKNNLDGPPVVSITNPINGQTVSGNVTISANATDDNGITKVWFLVDNVLKSTDTTVPYEYIWDSKSVSNGLCNIKVIAFDTMGQTAEA
ncbi:MAG: Ig-like domain-containing protein, partial [Bacteroidales bacterium]